MVRIRLVTIKTCHDFENLSKDGLCGWLNQMPGIMEKNTNPNESEISDLIIELSSLGAIKKETTTISWQELESLYQQDWNRFQQWALLNQFKFTKGHNYIERMLKLMFTIVQETTENNNDNCDSPVIHSPLHNPKQIDVIGPLLAPIFLAPRPDFSSKFSKMSTLSSAKEVTEYSKLIWEEVERTRQEWVDQIANAKRIFFARWKPFRDARIKDFHVNSERRRHLIEYCRDLNRFHKL